MNRDKEANQLMFAFLKESVKNLDHRLEYLVYDPELEPPKKGTCVFDEIDDCMYQNLKAFAKYIKSDKLFVTGLSATSFDGIECGNESKAINLLGFKRYNLSDDPIDMNPVIHERRDLN